MKIEIALLTRLNKCNNGIRRTASIQRNFEWVVVAVVSHRSGCRQRINWYRIMESLWQKQPDTSEFLYLPFPRQSQGERKSMSSQSLTSPISLLPKKTEHYPFPFQLLVDIGPVRNDFAFTSISSLGEQGIFQIGFVHLLNLCSRKLCLFCSVQIVSNGALPILHALAMARLPRLPSHFKRNTCLVLRMDNLFPANLSPFVF